MLEVDGTELVVQPAPPGTHGYDDLRRDATAIPLDEDLEVTVASLVDLVRIAEASEDRARVPALRARSSSPPPRPPPVPPDTRRSILSGSSRCSPATGASAS